MTGRRFEDWLDRTMRAIQRIYDRIVLGPEELR